jgi:hypothetical protein
MAVVEALVPWVAPVIPTVVRVVLRRAPPAVPVTPRHRERTHEVDANECRMGQEKS